MRDVEIRPMREEDVVDADRVCAEVLYTSFDGASPKQAGWRDPIAALRLRTERACRIFPGLRRA
ncbi:MAG TPA: hypothetical protein VLK59_17550, partial [Solirubrobacteraceae bacterium]|nr:hypothetical protein [Solirubrobacteraceae bacterium]